MTTALQAARERLDAYVQAVATQALILEPQRLRRLEDDLVMAARCQEGLPF